MDQQALAKEIAELIIQNTQFRVAIVGLVGTLIGAAITVGGNLLLHWFQNRKVGALDAARTKLLRKMLEARDWLKLSTLSRVVGADSETTRRLLIELGARGSEKPRQDGEEVWGLISKHPLEKID